MEKEWVAYPKMAQQPRTKEMAVLCFGLSRTSTMSLYTALKKLGYNSYHMVEASLDSANDSFVHWDRAIQAKYNDKGPPYIGQEDFDRMLWRYDAVTDIPCVLFVDELLAAYPGAKVVLTTRNPDTWVESVNHSFHEILSWKRWKLLELIDVQYVKRYIPILRSSLHTWSNGNPDSHEALKAGLLAHNEHVRSVVPAENLLEFQVQEGWEPLCRFLGKPVPEEGFPKVNEGTMAADLHYLVFWGRLFDVLGKWCRIGLPVVIAGAGWWWVSARGR